MLKFINKITKKFPKKQFIAFVKSPKQLLLTSAVGGAYAYWYFKDKKINVVTNNNASYHLAPSYALIKTAFCDNNIHSVVPITQQKNSLSPQDRKLLFRAFQLFHEGQYDKVYMTLLPLTRKHPKLKEAFALIERHQFKQAVDLLDQFIEQYPEVMTPYLMVKLAISLAYDDFNKSEELITRLVDRINQEDNYFKSLIFYYQSLFANSLYKNNKANRLKESGQDYYKKAQTLLPAIEKYNTDINLLRQHLDQMYSYHPYDIRDINDSVIVRVWLPQEALHTGHVSLATQNNYVSFYPENKTYISDIVKTSGRQFADSVGSDIQTLGRLPDVTVVLYELDANKIDEEFINFEKSNLDWNLFGSSVFAGNRNCAGLTRQLLYDGGIKKSGLVSEEWATLSRTTVIGIPLYYLFGSAVTVVSGVIGLQTVTPENIANIVKQAEFGEMLLFDQKYMNFYMSSILTETIELIGDDLARQNIIFPDYVKITSMSKHLGLKDCEIILEQIKTTTKGCSLLTANKNKALKILIMMGKLINSYRYNIYYFEHNGNSSSVGALFLSSKKEAMFAEMNERIELLQSKINRIENNIKYFEEDLKINKIGLNNIYSFYKRHCGYKNIPSVDDFFNKHVYDKNDAINLEIKNKLN